MCGCSEKDRARQHDLMDALRPDALRDLAERFDRDARAALMEAAVEGDFGRAAVASRLADVARIVRTRADGSRDVAYGDLSPAQVNATLVRALTG